MYEKNLGSVTLPLLLLICVSVAAGNQNRFLDREPPPVSPAARQDMETKLQEAKAQLDARPNDADAIIWFGRRLAYLGRFREAIDVFTAGAKKFSNDARFYRHRGHRRITVRQIDLAIADFRKAAELMRNKPDEIEPDGQPNSRNIPTSTLKFNIWYHLGLAYYIKGENEKALQSYRECLKVSNSPDRLVATSHWLYMTLRRMNRPEEAARALRTVNAKMDVIENTSYWKLLLMYRGDISFESLQVEALKESASAASHSTLYGLGNWHLYNGRRGEAAEIFRRIVASEQWTSFGYIAAEADLKKMSDML